MKTYINKDGKKVYISKMDNSYLLNAYRYFIRRLKRAQIDEVNMFSFGAGLQGEMAQYYFDRDSSEFSEFVQKLNDLVDSLKKEVIKRKLI